MKEPCEKSPAQCAELHTISGENEIRTRDTVTRMQV